MPHTVAGVVGVREEPGQPVIDTLVSALRSRHLLLVLYNCEHLIESTARVMHALIQSCPRVGILATSRERLGITGETAFSVPPLRTAGPALVPPADRLQDCEAVQLFIDRARAVRSSFALTPRNGPAVARICHQLDGIPLAIELAAARLRVLTAEQIADRVADRFHLLTGGTRTVLPRHQSLRALVNWSYDLLSEDEQVLFRRLSVFSGGWTLEAARRGMCQRVYRARQDP